MPTGSDSEPANARSTEQSWKPQKALAVNWSLRSALLGIMFGLAGTGFAIQFNLSPVLVFFLVLIAFWALGTLASCLHFRSLHYILDESCITKQSGILWKTSRAIPLEKLTNLDVRQGPAEKCFGFGQIWLFTASTGDTGPEEKLLGIGKPHETCRTILRQTLELKKKLPTGTETKIPQEILKHVQEMTSLLREIRDAACQPDTQTHQPQIPRDQ